MFQKIEEPPFRIGVVEDVQDPLKLGRVRVRVVQVHTDNLAELPTEDLPWATILGGTNNPFMSGIGIHAALLPGTWVICYFIDSAKQKPIVLGTIAGIPGGETNLSPTDNNTITEIANNTPPKTPPANTTSTVNGNTVTTEPPYIGSMTISHVNKLKAEIYKTDKTSDIDKSLRTNYTNLANAGVLTTDVVPEKTAGLLMAAHFKGFVAVIDYVKGTDSTDGPPNTSDYYRQGYTVITGVNTFEQPSRDNLTQPAMDKKSAVAQDATKFDVGIQPGVQKQGFKDPSGKFPLKGMQNESDINRLARGSKLNQTIVGEKEATRIQNIPVANSSTTWSQSPIPYAAVYPNNKVQATESGHVFEFDDTPGAERINLHHRAGTFHEIDSYGNATTRVKGIRTVIVEKDELVYIKGAGHITIDGDHSLYVKKALEIQVDGDANIKVNGNCNQEIKGDWNVTANNISISAKGTAKFASMASMEVGSTGMVTIGGAGTVTNLVGNLGAPIIVSAPSTPDNKTVPSYSVSIQVPSPVTRKDIVEMTLEDSPDITNVLYQDAPTPTKVASDTSTPLQVIAVSGICGFTDLSMSTQLTTNYKLADLVGSHPFPFRDGQHGLSAEQIACNLKQLAINVIEPLRERYKHLGFRINSCFREAGSDISKARGVSQHELGQAVDIGFSLIRGKPDDRAQYYNLAREIKDIVPYDQFLLEFRDGGSVWIHISFKLGPIRRQILTLNNDHTYGVGLHLLQ